eukprot:scaffold176975_cov33-Tisochrysis_lutea.AAC.2
MDGRGRSDRITSRLPTLGWHELAQFADGKLVSRVTPWGKYRTDRRSYPEAKVIQSQHHLSRVGNPLSSFWLLKSRAWAQAYAARDGIIIAACANEASR